MIQQPDLEAVSPYLVLGQSDEGGRPIIEVARLLHDVIVTFSPQGYYSVRTVEDECGPAVHCAFELEADADRLAAAVGAIEIIRYQRFRSERAFALDEAVASALRRAISRQRRRARPHQKDSYP
jgi:hypothetical protein